MSDLTHYPFKRITDDAMHFPCAVCQTPHGSEEGPYVLVDGLNIAIGPKCIQRAAAALKDGVA